MDLEEKRESHRLYPCQRKGEKGGEGSFSEIGNKKESANRLCYRRKGKKGCLFPAENRSRRKGKKTSAGSGGRNGRGGGKPPEDPRGMCEKEGAVIIYKGREEKGIVSPKKKNSEEGKKEKNRPAVMPFPTQEERRKKEKSQHHN